jgi:ubiquinone/menaquinone biosynthesis C-methylase UbiE
VSEVQDAVRQRYADAAKRIAGNGSTADSCCCCSDPDCGCGATYSAAELREIGLTAGVSLGCGNPTLLAGLQPGQIVLDLGSGAGLDVLLSARRVSPGGHAYGVDMTDEMLEVANQNRARAGIENATFLKGTIDAIPLPESAIDVVISNCVINLAEDKASVIREAYRVLKPGGLFAVADMVEVEPLAPQIKKQVDAWAGCISGTIAVDEYRKVMLEAGFAEPEVEIHSIQAMAGGHGSVGSAYIRARKPSTLLLE